MSGKGVKDSHRKCEICGVKERRHSEKLYFARFPLDENRCKAWLKAVGNEELVHLPIEKLNQLKNICGNHFQKKDFNKKENRLKKRAIPMLNLTSAPLSDSHFMEFPQRMWKNRNVSISEEPHHRLSTSIQAGQSGNVAVPEESRPGPSATIQAEQSKNVAVPEESRPGPSSATIQAEQSKNDTILEEPRPGPSSSIQARQSINERTPTKPTKRFKRNVETSGIKRKLEQDEEITPRKKKLIEKLRKTKCTLQSMKKSVKMIEKLESPILKEILLNASKNQRRKPKGKRWTTQNKISALAIFKRSPKTYRYLKKVMPLPSEQTLQNVLKKIPMQPGINKAVLRHLESIAKDRDEKDNLCCVLFDEMSIKPRLLYNVAADIVEGYEDFGELGRTDQLADHALVVMVQGLRQKFKQPIAIYFVKGTISSQKLAKLVKEIIRRISLTGFKVMNTVCDQGPTNMGALKILRELSGPTDDGGDHYFKVDGEKIYILYDIPHLFKSIRNNFLKNGTLLLNGKKAQWSHLIEVEEKNRNFLYLSKITQIHIAPKYRAKMKVKYAAQLLSNTVAAVIKLMSEAEKDANHSKELMETALVIQELDQLFDNTNGPSCHRDIKKGQRENVSQKTGHLEKWASWIKSLSTLKFVDKQGHEAKNVKCIEGYIISLKSLRGIWQSLAGIGFKYFNLRQVNQDGLENLFGVIRQNSPTNRNPTCAHFMAAMKTAVITKLSAPHSRGSNCEADSKILLTDFHDFIFQNNDAATEDGSSSGDEAEKENVPQSDIDYPVLSIAEDEFLHEDDLADIANQPIVYVSGYLASRILPALNCKKCSDNFVADSTQLNSDLYNYIQLREWWQDKRSLTYPSVDLCRVVQTLANLTETDLLPRLSERNICQLAVTLYTANCDTNWHTCSLHRTYIFKMLFSRLGLLLIRRQCQRINQGIALKEEGLADANKIAQQQGTAK